MLDIRNFFGKKVHMIGIGGSSMSGLAELLLKEGCAITGSDNARSSAVKRLEEKGAIIHFGHKEENVLGADLVVFSAAISQENPERKQAKQSNIPQMERSELLGQVMRGHQESLCISGVHGKTTVSAMLAKALMDCNLDPTVHIGGRFDAINGGMRIGGKGYFVAEACEFHGSFLMMHPTVATILNIDEDHLDYYKDIDDIENAFGNFLALLPENGKAVGLGDDERIVRLFSKLDKPSFTFGREEGNDYQAKNVVYKALGRPSFDVVYHGQTLATVELSVAGDFNILNALAAFATAHVVGADPKIVAESLSGFQGVHRRFELTGIIDGVKLYHDYGHNPVEMHAAISVATLQGAKRVWAVMQPHTYSRVKRLFNDYLTCTKSADITLVTDIFAAREVDPGDIHTSMLIEGMQANGVEAVYTPTFDDVEKYLLSHWQEGDLVLTMGCGNINLLNEQMNEHAKNR